MKIQRPAPETLPKVYALLRAAFPGSSWEEELVRRLHDNGRTIHEWVCIHAGRFVAYIAFTGAYRGSERCGLHLAPLAVAPELRGREIGSELLRFALRQEAIRGETLFVLGEPEYFKRFGFEPCSSPSSPFDSGNARFLCMRSFCDTPFTVGYEPEFAGKPAKARRRR